MTAAIAAALVLLLALGAVYGIGYSRGHERGHIAGMETADWLARHRAPLRSALGRIQEERRVIEAAEEITKQGK